MAYLIYSNFRKQQAKKVESFSADTFKCALFTSSYTPSQNVDCAYQVNAPSAPTLSQVSAGSLGATTYYCKVTYVNPAGETTASSESSLSVSANNVLKVTSPIATTGSVTSYNVYVSTTAGTETLQNVSPIAIGTDWTEPTSGLVSGAALPGSNTAQISGEVSAGLGYSTGGVTLTSTSWSTVLANSWTDVWTATTAYNLGQIVRPSAGNGYLYRCVAAGSSGSGPTWGTTVGGLTTDSGVTWLNQNTALNVFSCANPSWSVSGTISFRYAVFFDSTTMDLVGLFDPGVNQSGPTSGTIVIGLDPAGLFWN